MKILLTGASGFLGNALAKYWASRHELVLVNGRQNFSQNLSEAESVDLFVHAGFEVSFRADPLVLERNLQSCRAVIKFFEEGKAKSLLFISAAGVMGVSAQAKARNESELGNTDPEFKGYRETSYIQAKLQAEALFRSAGIPLTVVYPTTVFGAGMPRETLAAILESKICPPGGTSFLTLADFLSAMDLLVSGSANGEGFILNGKNILFRDFFHNARAELGRNKVFFTLPKAARSFFALGKLFPNSSFLSLAVIESAFGYKYYSAERFSKKYDWKPRNELQKAIAETLSAG